MQDATRHYINGGWVASIDGREMAVENPSTEEKIATISLGGAADADAAVAAAKAAFPAWAATDPLDRIAALERLMEVYKGQAEDMAQAISSEMGAPITLAKTAQVGAGAGHLKNTIRTAKGFAFERPLGDHAPGDMILYEPVGVCALITPWNWPMNQVMLKVAPALAAGCTMVLKPAEQAPLSAMLLAEMIDAAGFPPGVFNLVNGDGAGVGAHFTAHPDVDMVSFTGSTDTGRLFLKYASESNLKRVVLELGGKNPAVVMNDCEDLDQVAQYVTAGAFWNMGENCSASSRLIVHKDVKDELLSLMGKHLRDWQLGDPLDPQNRLGAMVSKAHFDKVRSYLEYAAEQQLNVVQGGKTEAGVFVQPTIVDGVAPDSRLFVEEIFGPVLSVTSFSDIDEAIALANDTIYGLAASAYTGSLRNALRLSREIRAGVVTINCFGEGDASTPFGGYKESGFGGRDKSIWAHDQYTELKTIWIDAS